MNQIQLFRNVFQSDNQKAVKVSSSQLLHCTVMALRFPLSFLIELTRVVLHAYSGEKYNVARRSISHRASPPPPLSRYGAKKSGFEQKFEYGFAFVDSAHRPGSPFLTVLRPRDTVVPSPQHDHVQPKKGRCPAVTDIRPVKPEYC